MLRQLAFVYWPRSRQRLHNFGSGELCTAMRKACTLLSPQLTPLRAPKQSCLVDKRLSSRPCTRLCGLAASVAVEPAETRSRLVGQECRDCSGTGKLAHGGYHRKNPLNSSKLLGTKWTARERLLGWRHFVVAEKRKTGVATYALLVATCDSKAQIWINIHNLKERARWACGWLQREQLNILDEDVGSTCKTCQGTGLAKGYMQL